MKLNTIITAGLFAIIGIGNESFTQHHSNKTDTKETVLTAHKEILFGYHPHNYKQHLKAQKTSNKLKPIEGKILEKHTMDNYKMPLMKAKRKGFHVEGRPPKVKNYKMPNR